MAQQIKPLTVMPASHTGIPVHVPATPLLTQLPAPGLGKTAENGPSVWVPAIHMEDPEGVSGTWL